MVIRIDLNSHYFCNNTCSKIPEAGEFSLQFLVTFGSSLRSIAQPRDTFFQTRQREPCLIDVMPVEVQVQLDISEGIAIF